MKKFYIFAPSILLIIIMGALFVVRHQETDQSQSTTDAIARAFSEKYNRTADNFLIETTEITDSFAKGSVRIQGEMGGGLWFAAKTTKGWELVFDGNGIIRCDVVDTYDLPADMVPSCINENGILRKNE